MPNHDEVCASCGRPLDDRYCERCGHDSLSAESAPYVPVVPISWSLVATADRAFFEKVWAANNTDADGLTIIFPAFCPERHFQLAGDRVLVGRTSARRGITPHVDLTGPPEDVGVSHSHAMLTSAPDGTWAVVDLGSANGTYLNDDFTRELTTTTAVPLKDGDRLHVGAWTTLTLRAGRA
jgi:hypothetical protein